MADLAPWALARDKGTRQRGTERGARWREFLDSFYRMDDGARAASLADEPDVTECDHWNALLAATAEQLARDFGLPRPDWVDGPSRFLARPLFAAGGAFKGVLLAESPPAFRRRGLFVTGNVLSRPSMLAARASRAARLG